MAKIILICGKICSGKTTYSKKLMNELKAVRLNPDEIMLHFFGEPLGDRYEEILQKTLNFIYYKAFEIYSSGINVIVDSGFWQRHYRNEANQYFLQNEVHPEWHFIDVSDTTWKKNIEKRNNAIQKTKSYDYYVDEGIISKFINPDDKPKPEEMDVWYNNNWT